MQSTTTLPDMVTEINVNIDSSTYYTINTEYVGLKRILDILIAVIVVALVLSWLSLILAILIRLESKGTVFFRQSRTGYLGKDFTILKYRTMYETNEYDEPCLHSMGNEDRRITRIGRFLRKTRIDEFPQFINVLFGEMSVVGPRPLAKYDVDQLMKAVPDDFKQILMIKPGITSIGQVKIGYAISITDLVNRLMCDKEYISKMSFSYDCIIIFKTIGVMMKGLGI